MSNGRFATSLHIMTLLQMSEGKLVSSDYIAGSININAAIVRKELSNLREHGMVDSKEGKGGGSMLGKPSKNIRLTDIYQAVKQNPLLGKTNNPNPACPVGKQINGHIDLLYATAEAALLKKLDKITLSDFVKQFS